MGINIPQMVEWEVEDIGLHAHIKVKGTEDMIALGLPHTLALNIVKRHNEAILWACHTCYRTACCAIEKICADLHIGKKE